MARPPNIVFFLLDNVGFGDPGCYGGGITRKAPTPRIDRLAAQGLRPLCLTGLLSCSPMASAEAEAMTGVAVVTRSALMDPAVASGILAMAQGPVPVAA